MTRWLRLLVAYHYAFCGRNASAFTTMRKHSLFYSAAAVVEIDSTSSSALCLTPNSITEPAELLYNALNTHLASLAATSSSSELALADFGTGGSMNTMYAFMFPVTALIAILSQSAGIGGAALLSPFLLLVFPLLGPDYPLASPTAAIASALWTECWGFASGLSGYWRRGLVDWGVAASFLVLSMPAALVGALVIEPLIASQTTLLQSVYAITMLGLCTFLVFGERPDEMRLPEECEIPEAEDNEASIVRQTTAADGTTYTYLQPSLSSPNTALITLAGATLTGILGVGMGEVVYPILVRVSCMRGPIAAGTSVAVVVLTAITAACVQVGTLAHDLSTTTVMMENSSMSFLAALQQVMPWDLVQYTVPGAVLGGQIAPYLMSKQLVDDELVERVVATVFGIVGLAFVVKIVIRG